MERRSIGNQPAQKRTVPRLQRCGGRAALLVMGTIGACSAAAPAGAPDRMGYLDNRVIRIGVDLDLGGAITYLSRSGSDVNLINSFDWGRQIQMSFYSGPVPFTPHGNKPNPAWAALGWNPIQSGDCFGNRSRVLSYRNDGREIYVRSVPMQWPLDNEPGECTFELWVRLDGPAAQVRSRLNNDRSDLTQYPARGQELPAVYTNAPWRRLMTYTGSRPFTGGAVSEIPSKWPPSGWQATENWTAMVDDRNWGVGIWEPGNSSFIGGFFGTPGKGGAKDSPTGYIAPTLNEILDHNIQYSFHYDVILGNVDEIRKYVYQHAAAPRPPDYRFVKDRQHWYYVNAADTGWPIRKALHVRMEGSDPQMIGPTALWQAKQAPVLTIEAAYHTGPAVAQVFWKRVDQPDFSESKSVTFPVIPDGRYHRYRVDLSASPEYSGAITGLRFDPEYAGKAGDSVDVREIGFRSP